MPRGGKRPGAGAPRGNLNAFKSGRYSSRYRTLVEALASIPEIRDMILAHHRLQKRKERQAIKLLRLSLINTLLQDPQKFNQIIKLLSPAQNPPSNLEKPQSEP